MRLPEPPKDLSGDHVATGAGSLTRAARCRAPRRKGGVVQKSLLRFFIEARRQGVVLIPIVMYANFIDRSNPAVYPKISVDRRASAANNLGCE